MVSKQLFQFSDHHFHKEQEDGQLSESSKSDLDDEDDEQISEDSDENAAAL